MTILRATFDMVRFESPRDLRLIVAAGGELIHWFPGIVGVEAGYRRQWLAGNRRNVFLIDYAVLVHDERVNSRCSIFGGPRYQAEPANQHVLSDVNVRSAGRIGALPIKNPEIISLVGLGVSLLGSIPFSLGEALG